MKPGTVNKSPLKIAYLIDSLAGIGSGTEGQLHKLIQGMVARGHKTELFILRHTDYTRNAPAFPCRIRCLEISRLFSVEAFRKLWRFRREMLAKRFNVVHGFFNDTALVLPPLMLASGIRGFTSRRDMGFWHTPANLFFLRLFRNARIKVICNSQMVAQVTRTREWKPASGVRVVYNGIDPFVATDSSTEYEYDWLPAKKKGVLRVNVVLVANIRPVKRIDELILAANQLKKINFQMHYYIIGAVLDKSYYENLQSLLHNLHLEDSFHFVGPVEEPRKILHNFDIGALTSASEGLSNTVMEYLAAGLPVVISRVGGNPELVADGVHGFLYDAGDFKDLAGRLSKLVMDPDLQKTFAANGKTAMYAFDMNKLIEKHEELYAS